MIKILITLCLVAVVVCQNNVVKDKLKEILGKHKDECLEQSKAEPELVDELLDDIHFPKNEELKCYFECAFSKSKFINDDLKLDSNMIKEVLPESTTDADKIVSKCENVGSGSKCAKAFDILRCVFYDLGAETSN
ncbi:hypothetical protein FQR65_LT07126 [Abscondita terminalis]|nr:hypothetical protein FQR65_LT07126 [Abscondita terminalis]